MSGGSANCPSRFATSRRPRRFRSRSLVLAVAVAASVAVAGGCTPPPTTGGLLDPTTMELWAAGDSLTVGWSPDSTVPLFSIAVSGAGFYSHGATNADILWQVQTFVDTFGAPERLVIMGGTNDAFYGVMPGALAAMDQLKTWLATENIDTWWVAEPGIEPVRAPGLAMANDWVLQQAQHIDCRNSVPAANFVDGVHPDPPGYEMLASCIIGGLPVPQ